MSKYFRFALLVVVVVGLMGGSAAYAGSPSVQLLSFDGNTFTYVYQVVQGLDASDSLTDFRVLAYTATADPYTMVSPTTGGSWARGRTTWNNLSTGQSGVEYKWYRGSVPPGANLSQPWTGNFTLTVPNTRPVAGIVTTMGASYIPISHSVNVPGPVPEPSSVVVLGSMLLGMTPFMRRFLKR